MEKPEPFQRLRRGALVVVPHPFRCLGQERTAAGQQQGEKKRAEEILGELMINGVAPDAIV